MRSQAVLMTGVLAAALAAPALGATGGSAEEYEKAKQAYLAKDFDTAEKLFRHQTKATPGLGPAHLYLARSLFYQKKYGEAVTEYERARELVMRSGQLKPDEERLLIDELGTSYSLSGQASEAKTLFETSIKRDPDYPMYYYNLARVHARKGDLDETIANLKQGFARKDHMPAGKTWPNPREDESFEKYLKKEKFQAAMKEMGF